MIDTVEKVYDGMVSALELDMSMLTTKKKDVYAVLFFGFCTAMSNMYDVDPEQLTMDFVKVLKEKFGFEEEKAAECFLFCMQVSRPRVNPEYHAVLRLGTDSFFDLEDGYFEDIKAAIPSVVESLA